MQHKEKNPEIIVFAGPNGSGKSTIGLLKNNRINKITATHSENISDSMILFNIVNAMDAKKNLTPEEFVNFNERFNIIKNRTRVTIYCLF